MTCLFWVLMVAVLVSFREVSGSEQRCDPDFNEYYNKEIVGCETCDGCLVGFEKDRNLSNIIMDEAKGALTCYGCRQCSEGNYQNSQNSYDSCLPCTYCEDNLKRQTKRQCSTMENSVCGPCLANYRDIYGDISNPCQSCASAGGVPGCNQSAALPIDLLRIEVNPLNTIDEKSGGESSREELAEDTSRIVIESKDHLSWLVLVVGSVLGVLICFALTMIALLLIKTMKRPNSLNTSLQSNIDQAFAEEALDLGTGPIFKNKRNSKLRLENERYHTGHGIKTHGSSPRNTGLERDSSSEYLIRCSPVVREKTNRTIQPSVHGGSSKYHKSFQNAKSETGDSIWKRPLVDGELNESEQERLMEPSKPSERQKVNTDHILVMREIGEKWRDLARKLRVTESEIQYLESDVRESEERVHQMLLLWQRKHFHSATVETACEALRSLRRIDLVTKLLNVDPRS